MKLERINDNQIRCTLSSQDLAERHLKLSELAYGNEKARLLFQDMMQQALKDFGFEVNDSPLMIEAIPTPGDSIVLIITKVDDPEELDTRFSKFTPFGDAGAPSESPFSKLDGAEDFLDLLNKVKEAAAGTKGMTPDTKEPASLKTGVAATVQPEPKEAKAETAPEKPEVIPTVKLFSFMNIDQVIRAAKMVNPSYCGPNTLYYDKNIRMYLLAILQDNYSTQDFNRVSNMLSEYANVEKATPGILAFLEEHCDQIIEDTAIATLSNL